MTTSEEREAMARRMREEAGWCRKTTKEHPEITGAIDLGDVCGIMQDAMHFCGIDGKTDAPTILDRLADLIDPTCRNVSGHQDVFECSECRCKVELTTEICNEHGEPFSVPLMPSFCPNCGARVVEGGDAR